MGFPRKFKERLELELKDLERPDYLWLTYAVCGVEKESCGWEGWIVESVTTKAEEDQPTGKWKRPLPIRDYDCVECGRPLFRTGASLRFEVSADQTPHWVLGVNYEAEEMEYDDD